MDSLPKHLLNDDPVDLIINISDSSPKWIILKKENIVKRGDTIGKFKSDLSKLKLLRGNHSQLIKNEQRQIKPERGEGDEDDEVEVSVIKATSEVSKPRRLLHTALISSHLISTPSNPLIDQTIQIYKPTEWIDCISRESKRIFVKDNWIIARILLPSVSKDLIGLKRLTLE